MKNTDRYLNEDALRYLGMKVLNLDSADDLDTKPGMPPWNLTTTASPVFSTLSLPIYKNN